jgi:AbrB family looped-hinge helix DNA binding protein
MSLATQDINNNLTFPTSKMIQDIRTVTITRKGQIVIPKEAREKAGLHTGTKIAIITHKDHVELRPLPKFSEAMETAILSEQVLAKDWDTPEEDEAWKDL